MRYQNTSGSCWAHFQIRIAAELTDFVAEGQNLTTVYMIILVYIKRYPVFCAQFYYIFVQVCLKFAVRTSLVI